MTLIVVGVVLLLVIIFVIAVVVIGALMWWRQAVHDAPVGRRRQDAAAFLRSQGTGARLPPQLRRLAGDQRTPATVRLLLAGLARYLDHPITLAPDAVPVLGQLDEVAIGSILLCLSWRSLPPDVWEAYFPPITSAQPLEPAGATARESRVVHTLRTYQQAGQHDRLLRYLDQTLPEWPVAATLMEVAREVLELQRNVDIARTTAVPDAVTSRLTQEADATASALWRLADRITAASASGVDSQRLRAQLDREDEKLQQLHPALRDARTGLAELMLTDVDDRDVLRRAEGRFRALAATARELQELEQGEPV